MAEAIRSAHPAIRVEGLGKLYRIYNKPSDLLLEFLSGKERHRKHWALKDVSFKVGHGEVVGVVGPNGAGKSTLLRILAGTLEKTVGDFEIDGKISAILELGTGFNPGYSGRENIVMGGMCLGMSKAEIMDRMDWVIDFSELGDVIDQPFKTYSSGMQARLTFSTAIAMDPDILIVDEALAAGDAYFVSKCMRRIKEICESGATIFFVSHSSYHIIELCQSAIWMDDGRVIDMGNAYDIVKAYEKKIWNEANRRHLSKAKNTSTRSQKSVFARTDIEFTHYSMRDSEGNDRRVFTSGEEIRIRVGWKGTSGVKNVCAGFRIDSDKHQAVTGYYSGEDGIFLNNGEVLKGQGEFEFHIPSLNLGTGEYYITISISEFDRVHGPHCKILSGDRIISFEMIREGKIPYKYICEINPKIIEMKRSTLDTRGL